MNETIIYEHPLNETIRVCLRLEQLFKEIDRELIDSTFFDTHKIITLVLNVLQLLDRPDLKTKLAKELTHHLTNLMRFNDNPEIDSSKLKELMNHLDELARNLIDSSGKIGQRLREIELLNSVRMHLANPGGTCSFDTPLYYYWLQQPVSIQQKLIKDWLNDFEQIRSAAEIILDLVRKHAKLEQKTAVRGFHQELLDPQSNLRMIRIGIAPHLPAYPEASIGRHFISIRFYAPDIQKRPAQYPHDLPFQVAYCIL